MGKEFCDLSWGNTQSDHCANEIGTIEYFVAVVILVQELTIKVANNGGKSLGMKTVTILSIPIIICTVFT